MKIVDLARRMIHLAGLTVKDESNPEGDIAIEFPGLRPGEKLYEELLIGEDVKGTEHPKIMRASEKLLPPDVIEKLIERSSSGVHRQDSDFLVMVLSQVVDGFEFDSGSDFKQPQISQAKIYPQ